MDIIVKSFEIIPIDIMREIKLDEDVVLTMMTPICYNVKDKDDFKVYLPDWENKFYEILMDFIKTTLNPKL